ncbi:MAG: ATP-binding cassette, subfamily multidrug efflux pump [Thermotogota bacterium]|nr:ATP-binding cassette, subfamily multidrug efflux pump [Thermotogota bacterium]MDK2865580.1 ATP-binding cassette, subfamily multidrug efflux pump [Thermotogota bacterium]HCZ07346.1 ABC transporter ATP-binding protein [Thermotogota bacterium]
MPEQIEETFERTQKDLTIFLRLWKYIRKYWLILILSLVLMLASALLDLVPPILIRNAIDRYMNVTHTFELVDGKWVEAPEGTFKLVKKADAYYLTDGNKEYMVDETFVKSIKEKDYQKLLTLGMIFMGVLLAQFASTYGHTYSTNYLGQRVVYDIRMNLYRHILRIPLSFFDRTPTGKIATRIANDTQNLSEFFSSVITSLVKDVFLIAGILYMMFNLSFYLTARTFFVIPLIIGATLIFRIFDRKAYRLVRTRIAALNAFLSEHISGMSLIQIFNRQKRKHGEFEEVSNRLLKAQLKQMIVFAIFRPLMDVIYHIGLCAVIWFGGKGILNGELSFGILYAFVSYVDMFFRPIRDIAEKYDILQNAFASAEKIFNLMDTPREKLNEGGRTIIPEASVEFQNVWFAYEDENWVLKDISFKIKEGERVGFVGETGAGKSSIMNLISGLYRIQKGRILIGGVPLEEYDLRALRRQIAVVQQDVFLFSGTILDNIRLFDESISRERVESVGREVKLDHFVSRFPNGYMSNVLERASTLSAGERQLVALARGKLFGARILLLDEATANVDVDTEFYIQQALEALKGVTLIVIAHRLATVRNLDRIYVVHAGRIVEVGTHQELMAKKGLYYDLYRVQYAEV